uniref:Intercellular adhesion molecule 1 n=1 Tax=Jaculus jaculus TaxID=51337 RepID=A0A8C5KKR3_JACJA
PASPWPAPPLLLALLAALLPGLGDAQISAIPTEAFLPRGSSVQVNCSATCSRSHTLGLETPFTKKELDSGENWKLFELSNLQKDDTPICFANCDHRQVTASTTITVYWLPESLEMAMLPQWQPVGSNLTLSCKVLGGAPRSQLSVVLLRGEVELSRQLVGGHPEDHTEVTTTVLVSRDDHLANFSCRVELDLRPQGLALLHNTSVPQQLRTFVLPATSPQIVTPDILEVGTVQPVLCSLDGLFPAFEAKVHLELGEQRLHSLTTNIEDFASAKALVEVTKEQEGTQWLVCVVELANHKLETQRNLTIYSFSPPSLTLSKPEVSEGSQVTVMCEAYGGALVMLSGAPAGPPSPQVYFSLNASVEDNQRRFFCSAALEVAGQVVYKNQSLELCVLYGPRLNEKDCLGNWTWQEGSRQTLRCQAWGNPSPRLNCSRKTDGTSLPIGVVKSVKREMNGTYVCHAVSTHGNVTREVFLTVLYHHQSNLAIFILVTSLAILLTVTAAIYTYNRQRKIKKYKLQKAQEEAPLKLKTQATPP